MAKRTYTTDPPVVNQLLVSDKIDVLLKDWVKTQQLRIAIRSKKMVFRVRVRYENQEFYGSMKITETEIILYPDDDKVKIIAFTESRLNGCSEMDSKGIQLNPRYDSNYQIIFKQMEDRDHALKAIRSIISSDSSDSELSDEKRCASDVGTETENSY